MFRQFFRHFLHMLLGLSLLLIGSHACAYVSIQLRPQVRVMQRELKLDDVAVITTTDLATLKWMMSLSIGRFFGTERSVILEQKALMQWLLHNVPNASSAKWSGPESVNIVFDSFGDSSKCIDAAQMALDAWLVKRTVRYEIVVQKSNLQLSASQVCHIRPIGESLSVSSRMTVWADVYDAERFVRTVAFSFKVSAYNEAWVARKALTEGTKVVAEQFERRLVDVTGLKESIDAPPEIWTRGAFRLLHALPEGKILTAAMLKGSTDVERGTLALLTTRVGAVQLETTVQVLQDGNKGALVPVRAIRGGRTIMAKVISEGYLETQ